MCRLVLMLGLSIGLVMHSAAFASSPILASSAGARLDSNLMKGGGTDDTAVLQRILDKAARGDPVQLILDGPALVSGLNVYGNTTIECTAGAGLYLKDNSSRSIVRNAHRSRGAVVDEHIALRGCFLNGNRDRQPFPDIARPDIPLAIPNRKEPDGSFLVGVQFSGVNDLRIEGVTFWNTSAFGALVSNAKEVVIRDVTIDHGGPPNANLLDYLTADGLHFKGPLQFVTIDNVRVRTGDDAIGLNANDYETDDITTRNDFGPYVGQGPITDVSINNLQLRDTWSGIRLLSTTERIDRIVINNISGTILGSAGVLILDRHVNPNTSGNIGSVIVNNIVAERSSVTQMTRPPFGMNAIAEDKKRIADEYARRRGKSRPFITIETHVEQLVLNNVLIRATDERPIIRVSQGGHVQTMTADVTVRDPGLKSIPLLLDEGGRVDSLKLALDWVGNAADEPKTAIVNKGGTIGRLQWVNTPPQYVKAELIDAHTIAVTFSQDVKASDLCAGVTIKVNGKPAEIVRALTDPSGAEVARYVLKNPVRNGTEATWAYAALLGAIQNASGTGLFSVAEKTVMHR